MIRIRIIIKIGIRIIIRIGIIKRTISGTWIRIMIIIKAKT